MAINFEDLLDPVFLNGFESELDTFAPDFIFKARTLCLPVLPDCVFTQPHYQEQLDSFLSDFFDI